MLDTQQIHRIIPRMYTTNPPVSAKFKKGDDVHVIEGRFGNGVVMGYNRDGYIVRFDCGMVSGFDESELAKGHKVEVKKTRRGKR